MTRPQRLLLVQRIIAAALVTLVVPAVIALGSVADEQPVREGEPAPRTVFADEQVRITDAEATDVARARAAESVEPIVVADRDAQAAIVRDVREAFTATRAVRIPVSDGPDTPPRIPPRNEQVEELLEQEPEIPREVAQELARLGDAELEVVERETISVAQEFARQRIGEDGLEDVLEDQLPVELALRSLPGDTATNIADPLLRLWLRPTVTIDPEATASARERAADEIVEVVEIWRRGEAIVREGELVEPMQLRAIEELGLTGATPLLDLLRAGLAMLLVTMVSAVYLQRMQPYVWVSGKKLVLLGMLVVAYAGLVVGTSLLTDATSAGWAYAVPAGALAMLTALLIHPVVGIATMLPAVVLVLLVLPGAAPFALFAAAAVLVSVPLTTSIGSRSQLRTATVRAGLTYPLLAAAITVVFGPREDLLVAIGAGMLNGVITAVAVQGAMPFLETAFRLPTVTALLDLADRNHPLLRELETKALGTYNHAVMVAHLTERACRAVGADALLGSVAALYHDIGKVRQPHFFIENQQGIANPHDELDPEVSAVILHSHVVDGVELATEYRLPPEVVACIGSHHGTMLVSYFYDKAVRQAGGDRSAVDEGHYRYHGTKPRSKEAAVLVLADCSEATTRAMAMSRGTIPREEIESTVDRLLQERIDDGQFDECDLTFRQIDLARATIVESLVGIYHPRIAYPSTEPDPGASSPEPPEPPGLPELPALAADLPATGRSRPEPPIAG